MPDHIICSFPNQSNIRSTKFFQVQFFGTGPTRKNGFELVHRTGTHPKYQWYIGTKLVFPDGLVRKKMKGQKICKPVFGLIRK